MPLFDALIIPQNNFSPPDPTMYTAAPDDRRQRLIEAGAMNCCPDGDFLSLMPSVDHDDGPVVEGATWLRRVLGF